MFWRRLDTLYHNKAVLLNRETYVFVCNVRQEISTTTNTHVCERCYLITGLIWLRGLFFTLHCAKLMIIFLKRNDRERYRTCLFTSRPSSSGICQEIKEVSRCSKHRFVLCAVEKQSIINNKTIEMGKIKLPKPMQHF